MYFTHESKRYLSLPAEASSLLIIRDKQDSSCPLASSKYFHF